MKDVTDSFYKQIMYKTKFLNLIFEMSYDGNIGLQEMFTFWNNATPEQLGQFEQLMQTNDLAGAWKLVQSVTGVELKGLKI